MFKLTDQRIYVIVDVKDTCVNLITIYDKKEIPNVSDKYIDDIIKNL